MQSNHGIAGRESDRETPADADGPDAYHGGNRFGKREACTGLNLVCLGRNAPSMSSFIPVRDMTIMMLGSRPCSLRARLLEEAWLRGVPNQAVQRYAVAQDAQG